VSGDGEGDAGGVAGAGEDTTSPIEQLDFVGELNGSSSSLVAEGAESSSTSGSGSGGVSFGDNDVRTFETDASERINEYMTHDDGDAENEDDTGRLTIGDDIRLDTLDIHTLNNTQEINAPPLLDDIEVLA
jgi:hypothetical protein